MFNSSGKVVLIVDDSPSIRREVRAILEKEGFSVREAGTEFGMYSSLEEYGVIADIIIMDVVLNDTNGFELVNKTRTTRKYRDIPIVMLTQHSDRENVLKAKIIGVQGYIVKPVNPGLLVERVKQVLEESAES
jgi:PleD family two-component response regulator